MEGKILEEGFVPPKLSVSIFGDLVFPKLSLLWVNNVGVF